MGKGALILIFDLEQWAVGSIVVWTLQDIFIKLLTTHLYIRGIVLTEDGKWDSTRGGEHSSLSEGGGGGLHLGRGKLRLGGGGGEEIPMLPQSVSNAI